ncbi:hypothetical protein ANN_25987 [Periplaneta americana]|uniref:DDE Tnp4 domain-containing protein n=1 Tax=Periplaneta americana TaxID=6978 RepID=A0ABQ8S549_PERAM|nr:hypothetical protein ANN_25987 [Periplaneta americana]
MSNEMAAFINVRARKCYRKRITTREEDYHSLLRFREENAEWLAEHFLGESTETRGRALSSKRRIEIYLRFINDPGFQADIGTDLGVHCSTVCKTIKTVAAKILDKAHLWIKFPMSFDELNAAKLQWNKVYNFSCAIGVIDCTHVPIAKPQLHGDEKARACNAKEEFTSTDAQWPGNPHGPEEREYNILLKKERVIIERCFGQLKRRFPCLNYLRVDLTKVPSVIISCALLHNVAKYLKDPLHEEKYEGYEDDDLDVEDGQDGQDVDAAEMRRRGLHRREEIMNIIHAGYNV